MLAPVRYRHVALAVRGERLALSRLEVGPDDQSPGAPRDELIQLYGLDENGQLALQIWFEVEDIDAAIAELDAAHARLEKQSTRAPLENTASRADHRVNELFADSRWEDIAVLFVGDLRLNDRRRGFGREAVGRDTFVGELKTIAELGITNIASDVISIRGERLALVRIRPGQRGPEAFYAELLRIVEIDVNERIVAYVGFDLDDVDAAIAELDARYLAGEAGPHAQVWRSAMDTLDEVNRHEPGPILSRVTYADHRRISFGSADFGRAVEEMWTLVPDAHYRAAAVHALDVHGTVATLLIEGADSNGNELQWSRIVLLLPDEPRMEVYEDDDLNAALTRFDKLSGPAPRLDNAASRMYARMQGYFDAQDWDALALTMSADIHRVDRRRVVSAEENRGREAAVIEAQIVAGFGARNGSLTVIAIRGQRVALIRSRFSGRDKRADAFHTETLCVIEIDLDGLVTEHIMFDLDDLDAAFAELDARYLAGDAAPHAHVWSVVVGVFDAHARHETPATTPDCVNVDHRRGTPLAHSDLKAIVTTLNELRPNLTNHVESVHLLRDRGALFTQVSHETSPEGFDADWRLINLLTVHGDKVSRCELFDEADIDAALARFDELSPSVHRLDNAANRVLEDYLSHFATRDWDAMARTLGDDFLSDDRRPVVNSGPRRGREVEIANVQAIAELGCPSITSTPIATRGVRLVFARHSASTAPGADAFSVEMMDVVEINGDNQIINITFYDLNQFDAAIAELDARFIAGEAAPYARVWSVIARGFDAVNQREIPAMAPDFIDIDHRQVARVGSGDLRAYLSVAFDDLVDSHLHVESVHRLTGVGAVVTHVAKGTSQDGLDVEWRLIDVVTIDGDLINRIEMFDETDFDVALARFDELCRPAKRLENAASRVVDRFNACFAARDWDALAELLADDVCDDDRRPVVSSAIQRGRDAHIANMRAIVELGMGTCDVGCHCHPRATIGALRTR